MLEYIKQNDTKQGIHIHIYIYTLEYIKDISTKIIQSSNLCYPSISKDLV